MKERFFEYVVVRWAVSFVVLIRAGIRRLLGKQYQAVSDACWLVRVPDLEPFRKVTLPVVLSSTGQAAPSGESVIAQAFLDDDASERTRTRYALGGRGELRLFGNLIVLKSRTKNEKGVVLLKYTETFDAFMAYFDVNAVARSYYIVLEPSWAGYCDPSILMYSYPGRSVIVQCYTDEDYSFIEEMQPGLKPIRLGPADWISPEGFAESTEREREYDLVMIANWGRHKQHRQLFRALRLIRQPLRVLLIGFPWEGRTRADIEAEAAVVGSHIAIEIEERIPYREVMDRLMRSKLLVFLSKKEGDNKAVVEGLFADVPAIVYEDSVGGARSRINEQTGVLTSYRNLADTVVRMLAERHRFAPRAWAVEHTGSRRATEKLEECLRTVARSHGEPFTRGIIEKSNSPNLTYRGGGSREMFEEDYRLLNNWRRIP